MPPSRSCVRSGQVAADLAEFAAQYQHYQEDDAATISDPHLF